MQLISLPVSPFAARVRIAIYAKDLQVSLLPPPAGWPHAWHGTMGPIGRVPVLICEDGLFPESEVILEYLEERFPSPPLLPGAPKDRARARLLARVVDLYLMPPIVALARPDVDDEQRPSLVAAVLEATHTIDELIGAGVFAAGENLSLADCALAPALFAAQVTAERLRFSVLAPNKNLARYAGTIDQHEAVRRVSVEMREGLRRLEEEAGD
jgi:glutathione S-transferase